MRRILSTCCLGICASISVLAKEPKAPIAVQIDVVSSTPLTVHLHFTNATTHAVYLAKTQACAAGDAPNVFDITSGNQKIRYTGALERVKAQFPADYIALAPHGSYEVKTLVTRYAFLPGKQTYQLQYTTEIWDESEKRHSTLLSNAVTTSFKSAAP